MFLLLPTLMLSMGAPIRVAELRCEYQIAPLGIDAPHPRLSWILESGRRAEMQTAYQIQAASRERKRRAFACTMETTSTASTKSLYSASSAGVSVPSFAFRRSSSTRASMSGSARRLRRAEADSDVNASVRGSNNRSR